MEELLLKLIEAAKADRNKLIHLKNAVVKMQQYELASNLKDLENELFPLSQEDNDAKLRAGNVALALKMCDLNATNATAYIVDACIKVLNEKQGGFSLEDAAKIVAKKKELYPTE